MTNAIQNTNGNSQVMAAPAHDDFMESITILAQRANYVGELKRRIMVQDKHYGVIPGCGDKPTLLKNGAELLCMAFKLASDANVEVQDLGNGHREYTVTTRLTSMASGELVATGLGSCSTLESKFRYRGNELELEGPCPKEFWNKPRPAQFKGKTAKKDENGQWMLYVKGAKQENPDIADVYNTVLKMASKRSLIDATLKATGGSCEFTQDIEDNPSAFGGYEDSEPARQTGKTSARVNPGPSNDDVDRANFEGAMNNLKAMNPAKFNTSLKVAGFNSLEEVPANKRQETFNLVNAAFQVKEA